MRSRNLALSTLIALAFATSPPAQAAGLGGSAVGTTWPVLHQDGANRDFVPLAGARDLVPKWSALQVRPAAAVVVIGPEGNLYTTTMDAGPCHLHALDTDGNPLWCSDQVRTAFSAPAVGPDGAVFVTDGTEVFRFEPDGSLVWRVPATARALGVAFTREGFLLILDSLGLATAYDPMSGAEVAQLAIPAGVIPRPDPLPANLRFFQAGAPDIGFDPAFVDFFIDAFFDFNTAVGNNLPAVHPETGRIFIAVSADPTVSEGVFYGIDFTPPSGDSPGALSIGCSAPVGLASGTSPAISADGQRVLAGDSGGFLTAFRVEDCSVAWTLALEAASLASPSVGLDGYFFMLVNRKVTAFRDDGTSATQLWQTDISPYAQARGFSSGRFNSVLPLAANALYAAASFFTAVGTAEIPTAHALVTLDPETGDIVSLADLGEESDSTVSLGGEGSVYVASKPLVKGVLLGIPPLRPFVTPAQSGIFAFEPVSFRTLTIDGLETARAFLERAGLGDAALELGRAELQLVAAAENLDRALARGEVERAAAAAASGHIQAARATVQAASKAPDPDLLLSVAERKLEAALAALGVE
jgi:hypothetical protein